MWPQKWYASASLGREQRGRPVRRAGDRHQRAADLGQEAAPRRRSCPPPLRAWRARTRAAPAVLNVPLASTVPCSSSATANGLPGMPAAAQAWASRTSSNVRRRTSGSRAERLDRGLERAAHPAALGGEDGEAEPRPARPPSARVRPPSSGPSSGISSAPRGSISARSAPSSRASASTATPSAATPSSAAARPIAEPALGARLGAVEQRQHRERDRQRAGPRQRAAAHAAARAEARTWRAGAPRGQRDGLREREAREQRRARPGGGLDAGHDADRERQLDRDQPAPDQASRGLVADPVGAQRGARARSVGELEQRGAGQHGAEEQREEHGEHAAPQGSSRARPSEAAWTQVGCHAGSPRMASRRHRPREASSTERRLGWRRAGRAQVHAAGRCSPRRSGRPRR